MENRQLVCSNAYKNIAYESQSLIHLEEMHFLNSELDIDDSGESPMVTEDRLPVPHQQ
jgi:hypothetical protein